MVNQLTRRLSRDLTSPIGLAGRVAGGRGGSRQLGGHPQGTVGHPTEASAGLLVSLTRIFDQGILVNGANHVWTYDYERQVFKIVRNAPDYSGLPD